MKTTIPIQNLKCGGCANTITKGISAIDAIKNVSVNVDDNTVTFSYETEEQVNEVKNKLKSLGYPVDGETNTLGDKAKSYVSCAIGKIS
jgi:copper chaperone CopZ